ncbi:MAG: type II secretion system F family protein [Actinomycetota bacterium]|nr:type II secretion system F family protein [Actinomycetota bacterium]
MDQALFAAIAVGVTMGAATILIGSGVLKARASASRRLAGLRETRTDVLEKGFSERAVAPMFQGVGRFAMRYTPQGWGARVDKRLMIAGWSPRIDSNSWAAIRVISLVSGVLLLFFVQGALTGTARLAAMGGSLLIGALGPEAILSRRVDERKAGMERDLPDVIDLLVISVEAGLGFEGALGRVVQNVPGELSDEFSRMLQETRVGVSRNAALRSLAERTDVDDLNTFIMALTQADAFGVSISRMLRVQADEMRVRRRLRAQERAFAAPVKMTFPLVLCIFPGIFTVLLGPAAIQISETLL